MKNRLSLLAVACLACGCGQTSCPYYFMTIDEEEFALRPELQQSDESATSLSTGFLDEGWSFPLPYPESCEVYFGVGSSLPVGPVTSGVLELTYIIGGMPFIPCRNADRTDYFFVTADNYDDFYFCLDASVSYFPTGEISPLAFEGKMFGVNWPYYRVDSVPIDLKGMVSGTSHRFGQVMVEKDRDYDQLGVFDSPGWTVPIRLDELAPRCIVSVFCTLSCYRKSSGEELYPYADFGHQVGWQVGGAGYYEDGVLTMGTYEDLYRPNTGFTPVPYAYSNKKYVVYPDFFSDGSRTKMQW